MLCYNYNILAECGFENIKLLFWIFMYLPLLFFFDSTKNVTIYIRNIWKMKFSNDAAGLKSQLDR